MSPQHLWRSTTHTRSTTSTLRYFMPFPVKNLRWMWSSRWPQNTSSRRSMNTSVSGNQTHICCGNRFQHIAWWWTRVLSALHVNVTLPFQSYPMISVSPTTTNLQVLLLKQYSSKTWANIKCQIILGPWHGDADIISLRDMLNLCMYLDGVQILWTLLPSSGMSCYSITAQDSSQRPCDPHCSWPSSTQCAWWMVREH